MGATAPPAERELVSLTNELPSNDGSSFAFGHVDARVTIVAKSDRSRRVMTDEVIRSLPPIRS